MFVSVLLGALFIGPLLEIILVVVRVLQLLVNLLHTFFSVLRDCVKILINYGRFKCLFNVNDLMRLANEDWQNGNFLQKLISVRESKIVTVHLF
jgi:hypothetical protein